MTMKADDRVLTYIVERELGEGGMGTVYLGRHTALDQLVAIKTLSPMLSRDEALRARFLQEANIQAKLRHPGIVQVLTADMESEQPSLVMEYIDGKSLSEVLELRGALPIDDALKIMTQVLSAVGYAHRQGVIHRDLKPSNVMVMANGEAKVTDFGIAKVLGSSKLTRTGTAMGSAHYMSPEQIRRPETVDARSDIYSLGCVFYEVLTGRPPFGEKDASGTESDYEVKTAHVTEAVPAIETVKSDIPAWVAKLVMSMLEKEPDQRPPSCEAIMAAFASGSNVEQTHVIQDNETADRGRPQSGRNDVQTTTVEAVETTSAQKKVDKSFEKTALVSIGLFGIVLVILFFGIDHQKPEAAAPVEAPAPLNEQIAENINRKQEPTAPLEPTTPQNEQIAENLPRQTEGGSHGGHAQSFRGNHKIALQWISWDYFGQIRTSGQNGDGSFPISGGQSSKTNGDYLRIEGVANQFEPNVVHFEGVIVTKVSHINGGEPCTRRGRFEFKRTQGRKYWRLQQMDNPCDGVTDYIDIYF